MTVSLTTLRESVFPDDLELLELLGLKRGRRGGREAIEGGGSESFSPPPATPAKIELSSTFGEELKTSLLSGQRAKTFKRIN